MRQEELPDFLQTWSSANDVSLEPRPEDGVFKLSWPIRAATGGQGYIDVSPDPKFREMVVVQHGTSEAGTVNPCGITRTRVDELGRKLTDLKQSLEMTRPQVKTWKYTPKIDIGSVKGFRF